MYLKEVALAPRDPEAFHDPVETLRGELTAGDNGSAFRAGYYHFIGGALMAAELMAADVGRVGPGPMDWINMPEFLAGITAEYYKLKTMPTHINSSPELRQLFNNGEGYPKNRRFRPDGWSDAKLEYYRARMDLLFEHVDLAVEQHKRGAEFIMNQLREWVNSPEYDRQCGSAMALTVSDRGDGSARSVAPAVSVPGQELPSVWSGSMEATPEVSVGSSQPSASPSNGRSGW